MLLKTTTKARTRRLAAHPEDEVEEEKHVLDTFGAAFDSHGGPLVDCLEEEFDTGRRAARCLTTCITGTELRLGIVISALRQR